MMFIYAIHFAPARACGGRYARFCQASWESVKFRLLNTAPDVRSQPAGPRLPGRDGPAGTRTVTQPAHRPGRQAGTGPAASAQGMIGVARQQHRARPQPGLTWTAGLSDPSPTRSAGHGPRSQQTQTGGAGPPALPATKSRPRQHLRRWPAAGPRQPRSDRAPEPVTNHSARAARPKWFQETNLTRRHSQWRHRADGGPEPVTNNSAKAAPTECPPGIKLD